MVLSSDKIERPDTCSKAHPIWWFSYNNHGNWGICAGDLTRCQSVWFWPGKETKETHKQLVPLEAYSNRLLIYFVREYAKVLGHFES